MQLGQIQNKDNAGSSEAAISREKAVLPYQNPAGFARRFRARGQLAKMVFYSRINGLVHLASAYQSVFMDWFEATKR